MTAVSLLDLLRRSEPVGGAAHGELSDSAGRLAAQLVEASLGDWCRIRQYEKDFTPVDWTDRATALEIDRSIYALHADWAAEADQILQRVRRLAESGHPVPKTDELQDALGLTRARLELTPETIAGAMDRMHPGQIIPAKDLRNELGLCLRT